MYAEKRDKRANQWKRPSICINYPSYSNSFFFLFVHRRVILQNRIFNGGVTYIIHTRVFVVVRVQMMSQCMQDEKRSITCVCV